MSTEQPGPGSGSRLQFLDLSEVTAPDTRAQLQHVLQPPAGGGPLPGTRGTVWRTPRNSSPEFEFGDGEISYYLTSFYQAIHYKDIQQACPRCSRAFPCPPRPPRPATAAMCCPLTPRPSCLAFR